MQVLSRFALDVNGKSGRGTQYRLQNRNVVPFTVDIQVKVKILIYHYSNIFF